jgi:hypothetical protein
MAQRKSYNLQVQAVLNSNIRSSDAAKYIQENK